MPLTDTAIRRAKPRPKPYKMFDAGGLFLLVTPSGGKWWRLKYRYANKEKLLSRGTYPQICLKVARDRCDQERKKLADKIDPAMNRKGVKLADAGELAQRAGLILQDMIPSLRAMEGRLSGQLAATHQVIAAYQHVRTQIDAILSAGNAVLADWRQEGANATGSALPGQGLESHNPEEPFHVQALEARLVFLRQLQTQVDGHASRHALHGAIEQKQQQGFATLRTQNITLIAEQVATFVRQVAELQNAAVIDSLANATRMATQGEQGTYVMAAQRTIRAIENLVGSTQQALTDMGRAAETITTHIAPVEAAGSLRISAPDGANVG